MSCTTSDFVPVDLDATKWDNIEPLYRALVDRVLKCPTCLKNLILDRANRRRPRMTNNYKWIQKH